MRINNGLPPQPQQTALALGYSRAARYMKHLRVEHADHSLATEFFDGFSGLLRELPDKSDVVSDLEQLFKTSVRDGIVSLRQLILEQDVRIVPVLQALERDSGLMKCLDVMMIAEITAEREGPLELLQYQTVLKSAVDAALQAGAPKKK